MIQDIKPHLFFNQYNKKSEVDENSIILCFEDNKILIQDELFPQFKDFDFLDKTRLIYLFSIDQDKKYFFLDIDELKSLIREDTILVSILLHLLLYNSLIGIEIINFVEDVVKKLFSIIRKEHLNVNVQILFILELFQLLLLL